MARPVRLEFSGALYHVTARGDRREAIYDDDTDREQFLKVLGEVVGQFNWRCHAYCLMDNHYHLMIATPDANLSIRAAWATGEYDYTDIARQFAVHFTTVGRIVREHARAKR